QHTLGQRDREGLRLAPRQIEQDVGTINNPQRHAGFRVLQAPDVPSILLEIGFLSNAEDEKLMLDEDWSGKIAGLLTDEVKRYRAAVMA
ncbi:N-acetylmuramoyl-L-alanine amidase family protein, partial [Rhizobium leguminosarum]|uniref:N-acetylmuramoyl-L-alanine amidase family protein n=1 Tax=Rhizobium leguminosarum TaxID=384 RepID=UPI003F963D1F